MQNGIDTDKADRRALLMLLASICMCGAAIGFETPLVVKITEFYHITDSDFGIVVAPTGESMPIDSLNQTA